MTGWISASVSLGVVSHLPDSRNPTRTHYPGDVPPVGASRLGTYRHPLLTMYLENNELAGDMNVG